MTAEPANEDPATSEDDQLGRYADPSTYLRTISEALQAEWPDNRLVRVVCHGHSVPAGYFRTPEIRPFDAYPHLTHRLVQEKYPTGMVDFVRTAVGGENAESGAERFERDVLSLRPDVVCIDYALNDRSIGLERAHMAWVSMIESALEQGAAVILFTPTPDLSAHDRWLAEHAVQIRSLASKYEVGLVDSSALFDEYASSQGPLEPLMSQPNHPNRLGHAIVAAHLARWFTQPVASE
ncbi:MAG: SGNH/GDSL hydrolase family protein [Planctomycetota bacterium]